jgi:hypothetical protein
MAVLNVFPEIGVPAKVIGLPTNSASSLHGPIDWSRSVPCGDGRDSVRVCLRDVADRTKIVVIKLIYDPQSATFTADAASAVVFDPGIGAWLLYTSFVACR